MNGNAARLSANPVVLDVELEQEFEARLAESSTLAFRVAYGVLRQRQDAEDVAQEALAKAYRSFRQLRDRERFRPWLVRMTWRLALNARRSALRRARRDLQHAAGASEAVAPPQASDARVAEIWKAIDALPEKLRVVVVLASIEGHDMREVAALLNLPEGTVKSRLFHARQYLKGQLS